MYEDDYFKDLINLTVKSFMIVYGIFMFIFVFVVPNPANCASISYVMILVFFIDQLYRVYERCKQRQAEKKL